MNTPKHTPGPWTHLGWGDIHGHEVNGGGVDIAAVYLREEDEKWLANARLIAAAPDLLEALRSVWLWMEDQADGQSKGGHATFDLMLLREQRDIARTAIAKATGGAT